MDELAFSSATSGPKLIVIFCWLSLYISYFENMVISVMDMVTMLSLAYRDLEMDDVDVDVLS